MFYFSGVLLLFLVKRKRENIRKLLLRKHCPFFVFFVVVQSYAAFNKNPAAHTKGNISVF